MSTTLVMIPPTTLFVQHVLTDITLLETSRRVKILQDNTKTNTHSNLCKVCRVTYNLGIIRIFGAAGHGKGFINTMSSFGAKSILRRDIVAFEVWFADSKEICSYLTDRTDEKISYSVVDPVRVDAGRQCKDAKIIPGCMVAAHVCLHFCATVKVAHLLTLNNVLERRQLHKFITLLKTVTILGCKLMKMARKHQKYLNLLKFLRKLH